MTSSPGAHAHRARVVVLASAALASAIVVAAALRAPYRALAELELARGTGWAAVVALFASLAMSPASAVLATRTPLFAALRRDLGLASVSFASVHFALVLATHLAPDLALLVLEPEERAGLAALLILVLLGLTSFPRTLRVHAWKDLHRLAYLAALLALLHVALSPMAPVGVLLATLTLLGALFVVRLGLRLLDQGRDHR